MTKAPPFGWLGALGCIAFASAISCRADDDDGDGDEGSPDLVGSVCEVPADCYPDVDPADIQGAVLCLDRVRAGYCTHECVEDTDCCAVEGECLTGYAQVCSPFESAGAKMCFLSCEDADVDAAGAPDDQSYCHGEVSYDFMCRSSGGGSENRKVCVPGDCGVGAACGNDAECGPGLECFGFDGGYCGVRGCAANADCPGGSLCIALEDDNVCVKSCVADGDCELCRNADHPVACTPEVEFVEAGTTGSVCRPS
jgi:hypothetical protein